MNEDCKPVLVENYGGLCTLIERSDLPVGLSPACRNVEFFPGGVQTRNGTSVVTYTGSGSSPGPAAPSGMISAIAEHVRSDGSRHVVFYDASGALWDLDPTTGVLARVAYDLAIGPSVVALDVRIKAVSLFGRLYLAIHDGLHGIAQARQYDGVNLDPISPQGPVDPPLIEFGENQPAEGGRTTPGIHDYVMVYETRSGYLSQCSTRGTVTVPVEGALGIFPWTTPFEGGSSGVIRRRLYMSAVRVDPDVAQTEFYTLPSLWIEDNTVDLSERYLVGAPDVELINGAPLGNIPLRQTLPPALGIEAYNKRLFAYGCLNMVPRLMDTSASTSFGLDNLDFDSRTAMTDHTTPGWAPTGGALNPAIVASIPGACGLCMAFTSNATATTIGPTTTIKTMEEYLTKGSLSKQLVYCVRVRLRKSATAGSSTSAAFQVTNVGGSVSFSTTVYNISTQWNWYSGTISSVGGVLGKLALSVVSANVIPTGQAIYCDSLEIYPADAPYAGSLVYVSDPEEPEVFDAETGLIQVSPDDGQEIRCAFQLRGNLYFAKERSLYVTSDNGEVPTSWRVDQVSAIVGTPSVDGVGIGEGWAVIASRTGVYLFDGGMPQKISQEIQPLWDRMRWEYGEKIRVMVSPEEKKVYIAVPMPLPLPWETAPTDLTPVRPNMFLTLDYIEGFGDPIQGRGQGRKWSITEFDNYGRYIASAAVVEWSDRKPRVLFGGLNYLYYDNATARVDDTYKYVSGAWTSTTASINNYYETAPIGAEMGRSLFSILAMKIRGGGKLVTRVRRPGYVENVEPPIPTLSDVYLGPHPIHDVELKINKTDTQLCVWIGTDTIPAVEHSEGPPHVDAVAAIPGWFILKRLAVWIKNAPFSFLRGHNL